MCRVVARACGTFPVQSACFNQSPPPTREKDTISTSTVILVTLIVYKVLLIAIGVWSSRRVRNETDFLLGGRQLGAWVAGLSYAASTSSAWLLLGYSGFVYAFGVAALWMVPGILAGYVAVWLWFGPRIRAESIANDWVTPTEFMAGTMDRRNAFWISLVATALIAFCFVFYIAAQFDAAASAFITNFDMGHASSLILGATIILVYCLLGGFWAASVTDTLQGVVMVLAAVIVPALAVIEAGGPAEIIDRIAATDPAFHDVTGGTSGFVLAGLILGLASIGLGTLGQPHLLARLMAVRGERERKRGFLVAITWGITVYVGMSWLALAARSLDLDTSNGEQIFYLLADRLLPPVLAGIVIAAILSAVMSTVDSLLLAASAAVAHDLRLADRFRINPLAMSRFVMVGIVAAATTMALTLPETIFNRVLFAWNALGAAFGPLIIARVCGREPPAGARIASIVVGFGLTVLFYSLGNADPASVGERWQLLANLAHLPGDPYERFIPFIPPLLIVFAWPPQNRGRPV